MAREMKKFLSSDETSNNYTILLLTPGRVEMCQSGVKGNFYAPFVREGGQATALPYLTYKRGYDRIRGDHKIQVPVQITGTPAGADPVIQPFLLRPGDQSQ